MYVKSNGKISQNFVAFSEYMNFSKTRKIDKFDFLYINKKSCNENTCYSVQKPISSALLKFENTIGLKCSYF